MPNYKYVCKDCGHEFVEFQYMNDKPLTHCPKCKGIPVRKIGAGMSPIFKGHGFYTTDYKNRSVV